MTRGETHFRSIIGLAAAVFTMLAAGPVEASSCQGRIGAETIINGKTDYNPFSPSDLADDYRISISNTGGEPCVFALVFRSRAAVPKLGRLLSYRLANAAHSSLLTNAPAASAPAVRSNGPVPPSRTVQVNYRLVIPRGQFAAPGQLRDDVELELYAVGENGRLAGRPLQTTRLAIAYRVARVMSVNIKGGDTTTTVNFGTLARGQERSVDIQVRSNARYQLDVSSDNRGVLALTPKISGQHWFVPYTATLDRYPLRLRRGASLENLDPTRPGFDASHTLAVRIGNVRGKRAGRYEDVITVEIRGARL